ncbi:dihydrouridine synthase [Kushneria phosphatilytica]|uniref:tRNA-dihydrouridine(16) synthase n=2 Tax=Kushneria phosphatilytica TaxID=657387 RepID=A0A1S1NZZ1_9GAMM|nr:dihydrouridine synthase [Kushneria phosphatilytica]QEL12717.1 tRNA-dihydrouridine synthase family protein [Kushneria phosphatilytica]
MEGVIDVITRDLLTARGGFDWAVTEFVRVTDTLLPPRVFHRICPELVHRAETSCGTPVHLQLLGSNPERLGDNARRAAELGAPCIDINFGCPAKTVNRHDGGASLLKTPQRVEAVVAGVHRALEGSGIPVTAKLRLGFEDKRLAVACAQAAEAGGAASLVVHARTRREGYRPPAYWQWVRRIRQHVSVETVVNGDIWTLEDYQRARAISGCDHVMLGRAALADPLLAARIRHWQATGEHQPPTRWQDRSTILKEYAYQASQSVPEKVVVSLLKQWLNIMRQHDRDAAERFVELRRIRELSPFLQTLNPSDHSEREEKEEAFTALQTDRQ